MRIVFPLLCALAALLAGPAAALGACQPTDITSIAYSGAALPPYNPFSSYPARTLTVTVSSAVPCTVDLAFETPASPPRMTGAGTLAYDIRPLSNATSLVYSGGTPSSTVRLDIGPGAGGAIGVQVVLPAGQVVGEGLYADTSLLAVLFDRSGAMLTPLKTSVVPLSGSVAGACQFASSSATTLNFTSAIQNGLPRPEHVQSVTFRNVSCTAPATVRLAADPMQLAQSPGPSPTFDSTIHFRASATMSNATAVLETSAGNTTSSAQRNVASGATIDGSVRLDVSLLAGKPLLPGTYASTLTLSIDPNP